MEEQELEIITEVFSQYMDVEGKDENAEGFLPTANLSDAIAALGLNLRHINAIKKTLDPGDTGKIQFEPFAEIMTVQLKSKSQDTTNDEVIDELFHLFTDTDRITLQDLQRISSTAVKDNANINQLEEMLSLSKSKTFVDINDFRDIMKQANAL